MRNDKTAMKTNAQYSEITGTEEVVFQVAPAGPITRFKISACAVAACLALSTAPVDAIPITGEIHFAGAFSAIDSVGGSASLGAATGLAFLNPAGVLFASGDFGTFVTPFVTPATFIPSFQFNPLSPSPVDPLWSAGGFSFSMSAVQITHQDNAQLNLLGTGWISGNGFDTTYGTWNFQGGGSGYLTFRASSTPGQYDVRVPDGGNTLMLLGVAILGVTFIGFVNGRRNAAA
jgi:hypothetical protein